jgi:hypothetical protein
MAPQKQWPAGHLIMTPSTGPPVERMVNRHLTSAGSPHRRAPSWSMWAGQFRNIIVASVNHRVRVQGRLPQACNAGRVDSPASRGS